MDKSSKTKHRKGKNQKNQKLAITSLQAGQNSRLQVGILR
jgi:hypothetical protein